ncbi:hypothetical protein HNO88_001261 [Novosphingobium chloroacetimidivorans]|uniref:Peptidase M61 n=2 Tax=Novosphingobium chloroacetimidivorans TaxID=1428314 RepID=A0A7W7NWB9_9SPHN|nr:hypothetical protein [Novosphingobium chloroacetimidivorans]
MAFVLTIAGMMAAAGPIGPSLEIDLSPRAVSGKVEAIDVTLVFEGVTAGADAPLLQIPLVSSNVDTVATGLTRVDARDAKGPIALVLHDVERPVQAAGDAEIGGKMREWNAVRAVSGRLTVRYTVPAHATLPPRGAAPPFAFSNDGQATSGAGHIFLLLPPGNAAYRTTVKWDLSKLPAGSKGVSSYGGGNATASEPLNASQLRMAYYMAGRIGTWPWPTPQRGFFAAWQGTPPFDAQALMGWTRDLYDRYAAFFGQKEPPQYGVFLRYNPINAGGGVGLYHSFVTTFGKPGLHGSDVDEVKSTLAHEMFHTFSPYIEEPAGLESSWFGEGLATFYQRRLPLRFGLITPAKFLEDLNFHAGRYYTSAMGDAPNGEVPKRFWADTRIRTLPYDRGMLYFADVDQKVRKRSGGKRSVDDLMLAMLALNKAGKTTTNADWEHLLEAELGASAVQEFRAFLAGKAPVPASDAFGPCFRSTTRPMRRYELGFDSAVLAEPRRIVRGVTAGSAAAAAGLKDGDEILVPVPQDQIQGEQGARLKLHVRRDGRDFDIEYLPRGETVDARQWELVPGADTRSCGI